MNVSRAKPKPETEALQCFRNKTAHRQDERPHVKTAPS